MKHDVKYEHVDGYGWDKYDSYSSRVLENNIKRGDAHPDPVSQVEVARLLWIRDAYLLAATGPHQCEEFEALLRGEREGRLCQWDAVHGGPTLPWRKNIETLRHGVGDRDDEKVNGEFEMDAYLDMRSSTN